MKQKDTYKYYQTITPDGLQDVVEPKKKEEKPIKKQQLYKYTGAVKRFNKVVISYMEECTMAVSEKQAYNNIAYRAKKKLGLMKTAGGIKLTGGFKIIEEE